MAKIKTIIVDLLLAFAIYTGRKPKNLPENLPLE